MQAKINIDLFKTESVATRKEDLKILTAINANNNRGKLCNCADWVTLLCSQSSLILSKCSKQLRNWCQNSVSGVPGAVMVRAHTKHLWLHYFCSWPKTLGKGRSKQSNNFCELFMGRVSFEIGIRSWQETGRYLCPGILNLGSNGSNFHKMNTAIYLCIPDEKKVSYPSPPRE